MLKEFWVVTGYHFFGTKLSYVVRNCRAILPPRGHFSEFQSALVFNANNFFQILLPRDECNWRLIGLKKITTYDIWRQIKASRFSHLTSTLNYNTSQAASELSRVAKQHISVDKLSSPNQLAEVYFAMKSELHLQVACLDHFCQLALRT